MFKGLRNILARKNADPPAMPAEEQRAYDLGRDIGGQFTAQAGAYIDERAAQIEKNYLEVLQKQIDSARYQDEHSPLLVARVEYGLFVEKVKEATEKLFDEAKLVLQEWDEVHAAIGMADEIDRLTKQLIENKIGLPLMVLGLEVMTQNADILKRADDNWRIKFPERSLLEPPEN